MRKTILAVIIGIFLIATIVGITLASRTNGEVIDDPAATLQVSFCPAADCEGIFIDALRTAKHSVDCALYDINSDRVMQAFLALSPTIPVRIVMDNDNRKNVQNHAGNSSDHLQIKFDPKNGLMHNKFCIIDGDLVTGGSMNPTYNDMHLNFNNFIIINSSKLSKNYEDEFAELWRGVFRSGSPNTNTAFTLNGTRVEQYFCPEDGCEEKVIAAISAANQSVRFLTFSFTSMPIAAALVEAKDRGVHVEGLYEKRQVNAYSVFDELQHQSISTFIAKNPTGGQLHHKVFIIDNRTVVTGSYNPTSNGNKGNDENILIIHDSGIAAEFTHEYDRVASFVLRDSK